MIAVLIQQQSQNGASEGHIKEEGINLEVFDEK
jgi:hypothetical protein